MKLARIATLLTAGILSASTAAQEEPSFLYTEDGEEVFGPDYLPQSARSRSLPMFIARPNAGIQVPDDLMLLSQEAFRPQANITALPAEPFSRQLPSEVPLLRNIRSQLDPAQIPRLRPSSPDRAPFGGQPAGDMKVHYVFVGQGAGAIVELPCGLAAIDLGGEFGPGEAKVDGGALFVEYLTAFLAAHPHYGNRVDTIVLSHPHADHISGADALRTSGIAVGALVDNGQSGSTGSLGKQSALRDWVTAQGGAYAAVELSAQVTATGVTNAAIDPFTCATITAFWGGANELIGQPGYNNPNNHSVLLRVDYGAASFMFLGDLEDTGAADLLAQYEENLGALDVDVFQLAHHGAGDDTSDALLDVLSPRIAVISMGTRASTAPHTAWDHGHPRLEAIDVLQQAPIIVTGERHPEAAFWAAPAQETDFVDVAVPRAVFGTGWEGTVIVTATAAGDYTVEQLGFQ